MSPGALAHARLEGLLREQLSSTLLLRERPAPLTVPIGIAALDELTGGLPRGALSEIVGPASSGRTGVMLRAVAGATRRQEVCALVDASDSFDPASAAAAGVDLERLLWVRCSDRAAKVKHQPGRAALRRLEQVLKVTDLLLQSGGFGMVVLDMGDVPGASVRRVPLTSWFRFRRAVETTATVLLLIEQEPSAKTCASLVLCLRRQAVCATEAVSERGWKIVGGEEIPAQNVVSHAVLLDGIRLRAEVLRSATQRKPMQSVGANFQLRVLKGHVLTGC